MRLKHYKVISLLQNLKVNKVKFVGLYSGAINTFGILSLSSMAFHLAFAHFISDQYLQTNVDILKTTKCVKFGFL